MSVRLGRGTVAVGIRRRAMPMRADAGAPIRPREVADHVLAQQQPIALIIEQQIIAGIIEQQQVEHQS